MKKINNSRKEYSNIDKKNVKWIEREKEKRGKGQKVK